MSIYLLALPILFILLYSSFRIFILKNENIKLELLITDELEKTSKMAEVALYYKEIAIRKSPISSMPTNVTMKDLMKLCHPDQHNNDARSNIVTAWLIEEYKKINVK